jgi:hypothetical protein
MGTLVYDGKSAIITIDDRVLAHLRIVILAKFRRQETFSFNWSVGAVSGSGRGTIWLGPGIPVYFQFDGSKEPVINRDWIDILMNAANSPAGLSVLPEPMPA